MTSILTLKTAGLRRSLLKPAMTLLLCLPCAGLQANADSFADATVIPYSNWSSDAASLFGKTSETGEPSHRLENDPGAGKTVWWKWTAPANGLCTVDTLIAYDGEFVSDSVMSVYTGAAVDALTRITANDDQGAGANGAYGNASGATFYATQGVTYHIAVDGRNPGGITLDNHKVILRLRHMLARAESRISVMGGYDDDVTGELINARFDLSKTAMHTYTLKVFMSGKTYSFAGLFGLDGFATHAIARTVAKGAPPAPPITIFVDGCQNGDFGLTTHLLGRSTAFGATVKKFTTAQPHGLKGIYSGSYHSGNDVGGVITLNTTATGAVTGAITNPDGTKATFGTALCERDASSCLVPAHCSLYTHKGYFMSYLSLTDGGAVDVLGTVDTRFFRPAAPGATFMPDGTKRFGVTLVGGTYTPPAAGKRALGFLDTTGAGQLSIPEFPGEITPAISEALNLGITNVFKFTTPLLRKPVLTLNKANGLVTGSILDQANKKRTLTGVLYRDGLTIRLRGQVSGTTRNVAFEVIP